MTWILASTGTASKSNFRRHPTIKPRRTTALDHNLHIFWWS
jgi:hypothetical protein